MELDNSYLAIVFLCAALALVPRRISAAQWKEYFEDVTGMHYSVDVSSLERLKGGVVRGWERQQWAQDNPHIGPGFLWLMQVDCAMRSYVVEDIRPIETTKGSTQLARELMGSYRGITNYFEPNDIDGARVAAFCEPDGTR
jgi:hypothetical protein